MASAAIMGGIAAGGQLLGGLFGNKGAEEAAKQIEQAGINANALNYQLYGQQRSDLAPYTQAGANSVNYLSYLLGIGGAPAGVTPAGQGGPSSSGPQYKPTASAMAGMDGKYGTIKQNGNGFQWIPGSGNARGFSFLYSSPQGDVYQRSSGGKGTGINIDYAVVGKDGKVNFAANPPLPGSSATGGQPGQSQITPAMQNDPNFGSLMRDFSASDFQTDPGYQFRLAEGQKALERSAASRGGLFSGGTLKDLTNYNSGMASQEYGNAYNRFQQNRATKYNQLASLAGLGQVSAGQINADTGNLGAQNSQNMLNTAAYAGNARASGYSAMGQGIGNAINTGLNWYQQSKKQNG